MATAQGCTHMLVPGWAAQGLRHMGMPHAGARKSALPHAITFVHCSHMQGVEG
jgi:hypothetical protein